MKLITHKDEMLKAIEEGMDSVASIVAKTLGPGGLPILIERTGQALNGDPLGPLITKDGVTVAANCFSPNSLQDITIQAVKAICQKTNRVAGDGTTTAIVLGQAILKESLKLIREEGLNPQDVRRSIEESAERVLNLLTEFSIPCQEYNLIENVATISANGDKEIGSVIRAAFEEVGADGVITVDEGGGAHHQLEIVDGYQFPRGAEGQDRFFNNDQNTKFEADNAQVVLFDGKLTSIQDVTHVLELIRQEAQANSKAMPPVVFIANTFSADVIQFLLINKAQGGFSFCAVRSPHQTSVTTQMLDDIGVFLGGTRLGNGSISMGACTLDDIGIAKKVSIDRYTCTLFEGMGDEESILQRIDQVKAQKEAANNDYDKAILSERAGSLSGGIAKILVGGLTDLEVKEKYHRIEDAVNAARAAVAEGIIPGGGSTFLRLVSKLEKDADQSAGNKILCKALKYPFNQILANLGIQELTSEQQQQFLESQNKVFDGQTGKIVDALEAGVVDPVKVTKTAFSNAISIAALLSTCGGSITNMRNN